MSVPFCCWGPHPWFKKKALYYVGWGRGGDFKRYRLRFCYAHAALVDEHLAECEAGTLEAALRRGELPEAKCLACSKPITEVAWQVFITGYPAQDERKDYWSQIHVDCQLPDYLRDSYLNPEA